MTEDTDSDIKPLISGHWGSLLIAAGGGFVTLAASSIPALIGLGPDRTQAGAESMRAQTELIRELSEQVRSSDEQMRALNASVTELRLENASLRATVNTTLSIQDILCDLIESKPGIDWVKLAEVENNPEPVFRMVCLDTDYRQRFALSRYAYIGDTDFDVWPEETAQIFYGHDLSVYQTRSTLITIETWQSPRTGDMVTERVTKYYFAFGDTVFIIGSIESVEQGDQ